MAWPLGLRNNCPKRLADLSSDLSSEEETENSYVSCVRSQLIGCSVQNCNLSNCANKFPTSSNSQATSHPGERSGSAACTSMDESTGCPAFCNPIALPVCGVSNNSNQAPIPSCIKRSNAPNIVGHSPSPNALTLPSVSNARICNSVNRPPIAAINPFSDSASNSSHESPQHSPCNASPSDEDLGAAVAIVAAPGISIIPSIGSIGNGAHSLSNITDNQRSQMALTNNQEGSSDSVDGTLSAQSKPEKVVNLPQNAGNNNHHGNPSPGPLYNWQATMTTVKERFAFLFNNEILSDVHFRVGKGETSQRIPAHKFVLAVGSAVFDAMFYGKLSTRQDEIELPDVEPQAFLSLLRFLYSDEVQIGPETVMTVLYTAKKYAVPSLERHCVDYLKGNLSPDNAFMLLTQARLFDEPQLAALCLDTIDKNTSDSLMADGFTDIDHNTLCMVLERDTLRIREALLFQAVVRWSEARCNVENILVNGENQRSLLARALSLVRFPLMTIEEFAQGPAQSNILTDQEIVQLFLYFTVNPKPSVCFLDIPRCCMTGKEQTVCRFQQIESRWGYSGTSDRIRFIVDRRIFVVGFGMYGSIHGPSEYEVTIQIIHTGTGKVCISNDMNFVSDGTVNTFRVMFKKPFEVMPNTNYTAYATLKGPDSHYGTKGMRKLSVECPSGDRVTFQFTYAAGNNNGTSVEDGQIPEIIFYT